MNSLQERKNEDQAWSSDCCLVTDGKYTKVTLYLKKQTSVASRAKHHSSLILLTPSQDKEEREGEGDDHKQQREEMTSGSLLVSFWYRN